MELNLPLVGLTKEKQRLANAVVAGEPVLLLGPHGSGKTRLIRDVLRGGRGVVYIAWEETFHDLLVAIARGLTTAGHSEFIRRAQLGRNPNQWLSHQTSIHLRGLLGNAIQREPIALFLDGVRHAGFPAYRFFQKIYYTQGVCLSASACDGISLGALGRLFWDPRQVINVAPLGERECEELFQAAADHFRLQGLELEDFREKVLDSARGNPGQIIEMCRLASQPQYVSGRYIKFAPLRIDTLIRFTG